MSVPRDAGRRRTADSPNHSRSKGEPPGLPTDPDRLDELGFGFCLRKLTMAPRTEHELSEAMMGRGYPTDSIDRVIARLRRAGYVDDQLFASMWVESRHRGRGLARRRLAGELRDKGVEQEIADEALDTIGSANERDRARALVLAKLTHLSAAVLADPRKLTGRLVSMLARRGYGAGLAYSVVSEVLRERRDDSGLELDVDALLEGLN